MGTLYKIPLSLIRPKGNLRAIGGSVGLEDCQRYARFWIRSVGVSEKECIVVFCFEVSDVKVILENKGLSYKKSVNYLSE